MTPIDRPHDEADDPSDATTVLTREQLAQALAAYDDSGHYLIAIGGTKTSAPIEIGATPVTVGRDPQRVLSFNDTDLSRFHAEVAVVSGCVVVEDMKSTNGTFVNDERIQGRRALQHGDVVRLGRQIFRYERLRRRDVDGAKRLAHDLSVASSYVRALLPEPLTAGPVQAAWHFEPSMQLGGDAFGYRWLDEATFVFFLIDVSGHGASSAMHSVTVLNLLRQQALPGVDFANPAEVLTNLNARFQMEQHGGLFFTMWYGTYRAGDRSLSYCSAGHHPAYLVPADRREAQPLGTRALMIGAMDDTVYKAGTATVPEGSSIYLFSDGAFEVDTSDGAMWGLADFLPLLIEPPHPGPAEPVRLYRAVTTAAGRTPLADDFSLVVLTFA